MSESHLFRQYAKEAIVGSLESKDESEKQVLSGLADMWMKAALVSEKIFGSPLMSPPRGVGETAPPSQS